MESGEGAARVRHSEATPIVEDMMFAYGAISAACCCRMSTEHWSYTALYLNPSFVIY